MKVLCAGLSKTGTTSLHQALKLLGYNSLHYDTERLTDIVYGETANPDFRRYDDLDAVSDLPSAYYFRELLEAYPNAKVVLTVRPLQQWWESVQSHFNVRVPIVEPTYKDRLKAYFNGKDLSDWEESNRFRTRLRNLVYGSVEAIEFSYKKRYQEHNAAVIREAQRERLLVLDVTEKPGWEELCKFLGHAVPSAPFPHANRSKQPPGSDKQALRPDPASNGLQANPAG